MYDNKDFYNSNNNNGYNNDNAQSNNNGYQKDEVKVESFTEAPHYSAPSGSGYTQYGPNPNKQPQKNKSGKSGKTAAKVIAAVLAIAIVGGGAGFGGAYLANNNLASVETSASQNYQTAATSKSTSTPAKDSTINLMGNTNTSGGSGSDAVASMLSNVKPSVVFITAKFSDGTDSGTGIVMSDDGYIVTNAHVIQEEQSVYDQNTNGNSKSGSNANAIFGGNDPFSSIFGGLGGGFGFGGSVQTKVVNSSDITVTLSTTDGTDGKDYTAKVIGADTTTDLAVLKIDATGLTPASIGDSTKLEIGESCYTLGFPLGIGLSASNGIVSGLNRDVGIEMSNGQTQNIALIQTTAAINPGNSGGPLLDSNGNVIGITSAKLVNSEVEGFGFAIPISSAMPIVNELMTTGTYKSNAPTIGLSGRDLNATYARYYNLPVSSGILVASVESGGAADLAGIKANDIIVKADGKPVTSLDDLTAIKNKHAVGDKMTLTLARDSGDQDVTITLQSESD
jgi:serine protease Do